jgi:sugar phosphate isomerase/epimerase
MIGVDVPFPTAAELAATHDFAGIQVDLDYLRDRGPDDYRAVLSDHDLRSGSVGLPLRIDGEREEYEEGLDRLEETAAAVAEIGCDRASTYIFSFSDERPFDENFAFHRERLEPVAETLDAHGIRLGLEFLGPATLRDGHEYEFVHTADGMLELCDAVGPDNVGLLLDSWHWYTAGGDVETLRSLEAEDVVDVHVNDAPERPRDEQIDDDRRLPAETGVIDVGAFLSALDRMGYDGPVTVEPFSDDVEALAPADAVAATKEALDAAWSEAGLDG